MSPTIAGQFDRIINLTIILVVVPYVYASIATIKVIHDRVGRGRTFTIFKFVAVAAVAYCLWTVLGGDPKTVVDALVALLLSVPLYPFFMKSMENVAKRKEDLRLAASAGSFHS